MPLNKFNPKYQEIYSKSLEKKTQKLLQLMNELKDKDIAEPILSSINQEVEKVNQAESKKLFNVQLTKSFQNILKIVEKELNLVAKNHYRNMWMAIGMTAFGIPLGLVFGASLNNYGFIGIGIPIGFALGIAIGSKKDKEAQEQGRQLNIEV